jgi:hypothetical protein
LSRFLRKIGSWLGLFAILMATLAPTISHTLAAHADDDAMPDAHCAMASMASMSSMPSMDDGMAAMQDDATLASHTAATTGTPSGDSTSKHAQTSDGDACGYCSLLAHFPAMPNVGTLFVAAVRARQHAVATRFESVRRVEPLTFAQPRAPPLTS